MYSINENDKEHTTSLGDAISGGGIPMPIT